MEEFNVVFQNALDKQNYAMCEALGKVIMSSSRLVKRADGYTTFQGKYKILVEYKEKLAKIEKIKTQLTQKPDDPALNKAYAEILILTENDWAKALPYFMKAGDEEWKGIVQDEMDGIVPDDIAAKIGEFYWNLSEKENGEMSVHYKIHAAKFYEDSLNSFSGIRLKVVENRIKEANEAFEKLQTASVPVKTNPVKTTSSSFNFNTTWQDIVATTRKSNPIIGNGKIVATCNVGEGELKFFGGVLLPNGNIVLIPCRSPEINVYNPKTNKIVQTLVHGKGEYAFRGGVLLPNGDVLLVPLGSTEICIYNPQQNKIVKTCNKGSELYSGGVLLPDGNVFLTPYNLANITIYNAQKNTIIKRLPTEKTGEWIFDGCVLLPNGIVVLSPRCSNEIFVYDSQKNEIIKKLTHEEGNYAFCGGTILPNGNVVLIPQNSSNIVVYDPNKKKLFKNMHMKKGIMLLFLVGHYYPMEISF